MHDVYALLLPQVLPKYIYIIHRYTEQQSHCIFYNHPKSGEQKTSFVSLQCYLQFKFNVH